MTYGNFASAPHAETAPLGGEGLTYGNFASAPHAESLNIYNVEGGDRAVGGEV